MEQPLENNEDTVMVSFTVEILREVFYIEAETRPKAVTKALQEYREKFPDTQTPISILRSLAKTSVVKNSDKFSREAVEKFFSEGAKASA